MRTLALDAVFLQLDPLVKNWAISLLKHQETHGADQSFNLLVWGISCQNKINAGLARIPTENDPVYEQWQEVQSILRPHNLILELFRELCVNKKTITPLEWNERVSKILMENGAATIRLAKINSVLMRLNYGKMVSYSVMAIGYLH